MATKKLPFTNQCPSCRLPLTKCGNGFICSRCGWTIILNDEGWLMVSFNGKMSKFELERIREMVRFPD